MVISSIEEKKKESLKISIKEGTASGFASDLGNSLVVPLATEIGANAIHIGFLNALSGIISPLAQIKGDKLMEKYSRKRIASKNALRQALTWILIAVVGILYATNILRGYLPLILIAFYCIHSIFGGLIYPVWFSWMGDLIDDKKRGKYFGKRNIFVGVAGTVAILLGGFILDKFREVGYIFLGFGILFIVAFLFRFISYRYLKKQYEPKFKLKRKDYFSFWAFLKRYDNYGKFAVYQAFFNFAIMIASPFFAFYMLKELGFEHNYLLYMIVTLASTVFYVIFTPLAGKFSDKYGNLRLLWIANIFFVLSPIAWIFIKSTIWIILIPQLISGIANASLNIGIINYTYDSAKEEKRGLCIAYTNLLIGIGTFAGAIVGGFLINYVTTSWTSPFLFVFGLAAILRLLVVFIFLPQIKEVKRVPKVKLHMPIHLHLTSPLRMLHLGHSMPTHHINRKGIFRKL